MQFSLEEHQLKESLARIDRELAKANLDALKFDHVNAAKSVKTHGATSANHQQQHLQHLHPQQQRLQKQQPFHLAFSQSSGFPDARPLSKPFAAKEQPVAKGVPAKSNIAVLPHQPSPQLNGHRGQSIPSHDPVLALPQAQPMNYYYQQIPREVTDKVIPSYSLSKPSSTNVSGRARSLSQQKPALVANASDARAAMLQSNRM